MCLYQTIFFCFWLAITANVQFTEHFIKLGDPWQVDCDIPYKEAPSWYFVNADRSYNHYIYTYGRLENKGVMRYNVTQKAEKTWTLEVSHTIREHAGYYGCWPDPTTLEGRQYFKLILIEYSQVEYFFDETKLPTVNMNISYVSFDVLTPVFQCTYHYGTIKMREIDCQKLTTYAQTCSLKESFEPDEKVPQRCEIVFDNNNFKLWETKKLILIANHFSINFYLNPSKMEMFITYLGTNQTTPQFKCATNKESLAMSDVECKINKHGLNKCYLFETYDDVENAPTKCGIWFGDQLFNEKQFTVDAKEPFKLQAIVISSIFSAIVTIIVVNAVIVLLWKIRTGSQSKENDDIRKPLLPSIVYQEKANEKKALQEDKQILLDKLQELDKIIKKYRNDNKTQELDLGIIVDIHNDLKSIGVHQTVMKNNCKNIKIELSKKSKYGNHSVNSTHLNAESVMNIVMFAYTGVYNFNEKNYENDFNTAKDLGVVALVEQIVNGIHVSINAKNFMDIYKFSKSCQDNNFHRKVKDHIVSDFHNLIANIKDDITGDYEDLIEIASDKRLHSLDKFSKAEGEYKFYRVTKGFCERKKRLNLMPGFLNKSINLEVFSEDQLEKVMYFMEYLRERYKGIYKETTDYQFPTWLTDRITTLKVFKYAWSEKIAICNLQDRKLTPFEDFQYEFEKKGIRTAIMIRGITVCWSELWGNDVSISGLRIFYDNNCYYTYGTIDNHILRHQEIFFKENEFITKIKYKCTTDIIKSITFCTNLNEEYGPYGGDEGKAGELVPPTSGGFLAGIQGVEMWCAKAKVMTQLSFCWGQEYIIGK